MNSTLKIQQMLSWQQMLFYLLLTLFSSSAPAPTHHSADVQSPLSVDWEEARQIWSELRLSKKQLTAAAAARTRRSTPTPMPPDHAALNSLSEVPSYVKELYWNISVKGSEDIDTTTIRSLPALHQGDECGFNFSISEVAQHEIFKRAELRIHMKQPSGDQVYPVYLQLYHGKHEGNYKIVYPNREGWIVFDVLSHIRRWRDHDHPNKNIHFYIHTYTNTNDFQKGENWKTCVDSPIKFDKAPMPGNSTQHSEDFHPLLMIYSRDLNTINFNKTALIEAAKATQNESSSTDRRRRNTPEYNSEETPTEELPEARLESCRKHTLEIDLDTFNRIWHLAQSTQTAIAPMTFSINVCGGGCSRDVPMTLAQHSLILYYLHTHDHSQEYRNTVWGQCCAPVKYSNIETLFRLPGGEFRIVSIRDISVEECSCLTIFESSTEATPSSR